MIENIRNMWYAMLPDTQLQAVAAIMVEFRLSSSTFIKQTWMQKGAIPEEHQSKLVTMFQALLKAQNDK